MLLTLSSLLLKTFWFCKSGLFLVEQAGNTSDCYGDYCPSKSPIVSEGFTYSIALCELTEIGGVLDALQAIKNKAKKVFYNCR